jgi:hypothetical protein
MEDGERDGMGSSTGGSGPCKHWTNPTNKWALYWALAGLSHDDVSYRSSAFFFLIYTVGLLTDGASCNGC